MLTLKRTTSENTDFITLVAELDKRLHIVDGDDHPFFAQFNKIDTIKEVVVAYQQGLAVGCGAFKEFETGTVEIKRMFVRENQRGQGIASAILGELEAWATELHYTKAILETGRKMPEAQALYLKNGYVITENYGPYKGIDLSVCFGKKLIHQ